MVNMIEDRDTFTWALRILKQWARNRGIYGFNFGYLNGISLVIMLIKAQQYLTQDYQQQQTTLTKLKEVKQFPKLDQTMPETPLQSFICNKDNKPSLEQKCCPTKVSELLLKFFELFASWNFNYGPIFIHQTSTHEIDYDMQDEARKSAFAVLTPLKPYQCTTIGTTKSA